VLLYYKVYSINDEHQMQDVLYSWFVMHIKKLTDTELFNPASVMCKLCCSGRDEMLTLHALHWNWKKTLRLPVLFVKWYRKVRIASHLYDYVASVYCYFISCYFCVAAHSGE